MGITATDFTSRQGRAKRRVWPPLIINSAPLDAADRRTVLAWLSTNRRRLVAQLGRRTIGRIEIEARAHINLQRRIARALERRQ